MTLLATLIIVFGLVHINPAIPHWKTFAVSKLGKAYGPVYGIISLMLFASLLWAFRLAPSENWYVPAEWARYANFIFSLFGFIFLGIFLFRGSWRNRLKHPMAIGIVLWSVGHLLANGEQKSVLLFGGLAAIAILLATLKHLNGTFKMSDVRHGHNVLSVLGGIALYGIAAQLHTVVAGVPLVILK
jgi:uncharacterized membrane protein